MGGTIGALAVVAIAVAALLYRAKRRSATRWCKVPTAQPESTVAQSVAVGVAVGVATIAMTTESKVAPSSMLHDGDVKERNVHCHGAGTSAQRPQISHLHWLEQEMRI